MIDRESANMKIKPFISRLPHPESLEQARKTSAFAGWSLIDLAKNILSSSDDRYKEMKHVRDFFILLFLRKTMSIRCDCLKKCIEIVKVVQESS